MAYFLLPIYLVYPISKAETHLMHSNCLVCQTGRPHVFFKEASQKGSKTREKEKKIQKSEMFAEFEKKSN